MQFIKNGPEIPERLLQEHEDGRVVFFCGAGISYPAGLPSFRGLVDKLYGDLPAQPDSVESAARKNGQYDTVIGLLERRIAGNRATVREKIAHILTPDFSRPHVTASHEALLTLARSREGLYRLITTNFDRLFEKVVEERRISLQTYQAPLLPLPKSRWCGLVYLHGLLPDTLNDSDLQHLVLSSGDFGLAYLTERWAARFVSELFRNFTVCFVGYSISDPVLRYMMDALAADRLLGESPPEVFAFGSHSKGQEAEAADEWRAKNVTPILYQIGHSHIRLHNTLKAWADTYRNGALGKECIIAQYATIRPLASTKEDDFIGRVLWALSDPCGLPAKRFAELNPAPPFDWFEELAKARFGHDDLPRFGVSPSPKTEAKSPAFSLVLRPTPYPLSPPMTLVQRGNSAASGWDQVMVHLANWLTKHLKEPKLLLWVAAQGGTLHPRFSNIIAHELEKCPISSPMGTLWQLVLSGRVRSESRDLDFYQWERRFARDGLTLTLRLQLRELLTPYVRLSAPYHLLEDEETGIATAVSRIRDLVKWEIVLGAKDPHYALGELRKLPQWQAALPELLSDATTLLRDTLDLMRELGGASDRSDSSYWKQPSISEHPQNQKFDDWTVLIDLTRDAFLDTAKVSQQRARLEVGRWGTISYPIFRRLAFFAAAHNPMFTPNEALALLVSDNQWWLWSNETMRESLRLLVAIGPKLEKEDSEILQDAILKGPPKEMFRDEIEPDELQRIIDRAVWLRLAKCESAGTVLESNAATRLQELTARYPKWKLADDERDEFPVWSGDGEE